ncbi:MAG: lipoyl domain-containing protein [Gemmataceae bacterium]
MEQGTFLGWLKRDGESVRAGEPLYRLEGDKAEQEIEATDSGVLRVAPDGPAEGDVVAVGTVLGHLVGSGAGEPAPAAQRAVTHFLPSPPSTGERGRG